MHDYMCDLATIDLASQFGLAYQLVQMKTMFNATSFDFPKLL